MAIREYKGARYVMRVAKAGLVHNSANTYEALELVQNTAGDTYLSVQPVPAGIPLSNTAYWILTAMTNAQLQQVITELNSLDTRVTNIEDELQTTFPNYVFIGDSYGSGWTPDGTTPSWVDKVVAALKLPEAQYQSQQEGGAGFTAGDDTRSYMVEIQKIVNRTTSEWRQGVGIVIIAGGHNDFYRGNIYDALTYNVPSTIITAKAAFPNAKIYVAQIARDCKLFTPGAANNLTYGQMQKCTNYYRRATESGAIYINGSEWALHNYTYFSSDGVHPNERGQEEIARAILCGLNGTTYIPYGDIHKCPVTLATGLSGSLNLWEELTGEGVSLNILQSTITFSARNLNYIDLCTNFAQPNYFTCDDTTGLDMSFNVIVNVTTTSGTQFTDAILRFSTNTETGNYRIRLLFPRQFDNTTGLKFYEIETLGRLSLQRS